MKKLKLGVEVKLDLMEVELTDKLCSIYVILDAAYYPLSDEFAKYDEPIYNNLFRALSERLRKDLGGLK